MLLKSPDLNQTLSLACALKKVFSFVIDLSAPQLLAFIAQVCWGKKKKKMPWSLLTTKALCKFPLLCTDGNNCYAIFLHSFKDILCLATFNCVTKLTWTTEFKKEVSPREECDTTRMCYNHTEKLDDFILSTLVRATHHKMLSQHWAL